MLDFQRHHRVKRRIWGNYKKAFFLNTSGSKVRALSLTSAGTTILSWRAIYMQCFVYSLLHVRLCVTHTLSYGDKGHLYDCTCVRRGWPGYWVHIRGYSLCTRIRAQTLLHARQGRTLDYSPIEWTETSNACIICAGCCNMLCNCADGLHFSAFHFNCSAAAFIRVKMSTKHNTSLL